MSDTITIPRETTTPAGPAAGEPVSRSVGFRESQRAFAAMPLAGHTAPWPVTMLLWAGAAVAHHGGQPGAMSVAVAAPVAAIVWWWQYERSKTRRMRRKHRRHAALVTFAALAWLAWAGTAGAGGWHAASLWIGHLVLLAPYWRRRTIPIPASADMLAAMPAEAPQPEAGPDDRLPEVVKWDTRVAVQGGAVPGSYLSGMDTVPNGLQWDIHLVAGRQTTMMVRSQQALLCSALDLPMDRLIVDGHPSGALSMARLIVTQGRPLAQQFDHPGADQVYNPQTGYAGVGMHADEQMAEWALFVPGWGLAGGVIVGGVGSGKSTLMKNIATIAKNLGYLSVWACCPVGGQSFPALLANVDWPAYAVAAGMRQLRAMVRVIEVRGALNNVLGRELHVPTPDSPGILGFIDEFHKLTSKANPDHKEANQLLEIIAREGRKACVALIVADQTVNLQQTFANNDVMRSNLWIKNLGVLRVSSEVEKGMIPGLDGVDPSELPERFPDGSPTSGLGYLRGQRTAPFRGWYTPNADQMLAAAPSTELDTITAKTIGDDYLKRRELRAQAQVDQALTLIALDPDLLEVIAAENPALAAAIAADAAAGRPRHRHADEQAAPSRVTSSGAVLSLAGDFGAAPSLRLPDDPAPAAPATQAGPADRQVSGPAQRVLELIGSGITGTGELQTAYGCGETRMRDLLNELEKLEKIVRVKKGVWALAGAAGPVLRSDRQLLAHAADLVVSSQFGSTAMLQRKLRAGFAEASTLIDDLQALDVVGPPTGDGAARKVLVRPEELPDLLERIHGGRQAA